MAEAAAGDPADDLAVVPDGLVADGVGIRRGHIQRDELALAAAGLFRRRRCRADEAAALQVHEAVEAGLEGAVDGTEFARPAAEALLETHGVQGTATDGTNA